ncbi:neutral cholesterol ester hydrolase 1 [Lingula anatina]|uniref:Neutral cholesterol ester hydrolase 1 n=1 Tax=Lingula anatina TaxID=7574 RepID=A0A1S3IAL7_LINAN|nr:neutral cholesterol ester hydrolase 1 [Lingula anatina]|eukprot:XP_013394901.1 neutral cholesterol ester hydrolase 1 [Lingula anatina]
MKTLLVAGVVVALAYATYCFLDVPVPSDFPETWKVKIMDGKLRGLGKLDSLMMFVTGDKDVRTHPWARWILNTVFKLLHTGLPWIQGTDQDVKVYYTTMRGLQVLTFEPIQSEHGRKRPAIVYFHGGGFALLSEEFAAPTLRILAKELGAMLFSVSYRMAPEHPFPAAYADCLSVTQYIIDNSDKFDIDSSRVAVAGDSAGGNLAAAVALTLKQQLKMQILMYPMLQALDFQLPSYKENSKYFQGFTNQRVLASSFLRYAGLPLNYTDALLINNHTSPKLKKSKYASYVDPKLNIPEHLATVSTKKYVVETSGGDENLSKEIKKIFTNPLFAPLMADDEALAQVAPAYIITAKYDPLQNDGIMYAHRLSKNGVMIKLHDYPAFHAFLQFSGGPFKLEIAERAVKDLVTFLKDHL